ncbi:DUF2254 domain-containing protein [Aurantimonas sp. MSK8Z-1]|uniref:DUF2254 domain-containing protein n=1 Tax=Mangrovibrevibacter kandeliae TaxID=2968473 RepID=UPI002118403B|nr:DUF2254 domain-containing protein [Aurantimonas sp. MSK8Z-1]MCW4116925.1 DUF2254 domain-containing protein [Aurantimonas sp. MSK8Z-1]
MRAKVLKIYEEIRSSYWFIPSVLAILAAVLSFVLVYVDTYLTPQFWGDTPFLFASQPDGARAVLGAIGGSMIGVAGTVFSVTMATVVFASGSYGPRLLTNFMNNRGNQFTLGVFTATFVYSVLVLRTVHSADEAAAAGAPAAPFVPNVAILVAIVLALCSIGVLIFFIHHVPANIHISNVIDGIGRALVGEIEERFPSPIGAPPPDPETAAAAFWQVPAPFRAGSQSPPDEPGYGEVLADRSGYIQFIDETTLMSAARDHQLVIRMVVQAGSFIFPGTVLFDAWPAERLNDKACDAVRSALAIGARRTPADDLLFLIDELVEIGGRALSPGVNDPYTAVTCIDWMSAFMAGVAGREPPSPLRLDADGKLRVIGLPADFALYLEQSFGHLRQYAAGDPIAATHFLDVLGRIAKTCTRTEDLRVLRQMGAELLELSGETLTGASLARVREAGGRLAGVLEHPLHREPMPALHRRDAERVAPA